MEQKPRFTRESLPAGYLALLGTIDMLRTFSRIDDENGEYADQLYEVVRWIDASPEREIEQANEIEQLRNLASTCYAGLGAECNLPEAWLDVFLAASNGDPFTTEGLLPFTLELPTGEKDV